jgi:hypothetical protein
MVRDKGWDRHMEETVLDVASLKFIIFGMGVPYP